MNVYASFTLVSALASTSPSKFNIASMVMRTQIQRLGLKLFSVSTFALLFDTKLNLDSNANANTQCEQAFTFIHVVDELFL